MARPIKRKVNLVYPSVLTKEPEMNINKLKFTLASLSVVLTGCANQSNFFDEGGRHGVMLNSGMPIVEIKYQTASECRYYMEINIKENKNNPNIKNICAIESSAKNLPFLGRIKNLVSNQNFETRFLSREACQAHARYQKTRPGSIYETICE